MPTALVRWPCGRRMVRHGQPKVWSVLLTLGTLKEPTMFTVFDLDCDDDVILVSPLLRSHGLAFVDEDSQVFALRPAAPRAGRYAWTWPRRRRRPRNLPLSLGGQPFSG